MKNKILFIVILAVSLYKLYPEVKLDIMDVIYGSGESPYYYCFHTDKVERGNYSISQNKEFVENLQYSFNVKNELLELIINNNEYYLMLYSKDFLFLQNKNENSCEIYTSTLGKGIDTFEKPSEVKASSFLVENKIEYNVNNLLKRSLSGLPFVPSKEEGWENCSLTLSWKNNFKKNFLVFLIGYVNFLKPNLYTDNSRPKEITVYLDNNYSKKYTIQLADTPNPQMIIFDQSFTTARILIEKVYKGNKWDDMCINFIYAGIK